MMSYSENLSDLGLYLSTGRKQLIPDLLAECDFFGGSYVAASSSSARFGRFARMLALFLLFFMIVVPASSSAILTVDQSGSGDYIKIQDAINAVPSQNNDRLFIFVSPGTYREKITVPEDKPFVTIVGAGAISTVVSWNEFGNTMESATAMILASDFAGMNITFQNTHGRGSQAPALRVSGDRAAFYGCRILSYQDTLLDNSGRHYYKDCYIEGGTDFICGDGLALFENCEVRSTSNNGGAVTAQRRSSTVEGTGYSFVKCRITGRGPAILGRPWGNFSTVVFAQTYMSKGIVPRGWDDWGKPDTHRTAFYGEYKCFGPGARRSKRVSWSRSLASMEVAPFLNISMINGEAWLSSSLPRISSWR